MPNGQFCWPLREGGGGVSNCDFMVRFNRAKGAICIPDEFLLVRWFTCWDSGNTATGGINGSSPLSGELQSSLII